MMKRWALAGFILLISVTGCSTVSNSDGDPLLGELLATGVSERAAAQCDFSSPPTPTRVLLGAVQMERERLEELLNASPGSNPEALDGFPVRPERKLDVCLYQDPAVDNPNVVAVAVYDPTGTQDREGGVTILNLWPSDRIEN